MSGPKKVVLAKRCNADTKISIIPIHGKKFRSMFDFEIKIRSGAAFIDCGRMEEEGFLLFIIVLFL